MFNRIDASKSTKGASKLRRDLINAEIANLRDLLPLPPSTRQRLSQLQLMALVCVFLRKANYFQHVLKKDQESASVPTPNIGFSKAMSGFIMMMTQQGKLLYISENAAEYLGHSMEDLLIHGDSVYDVVDKQDHMVIQNQLARSSSGASGVGGVGVGNNGAPGTTTLPDDRRLFLCRINVSRNSRRQLRFGDQKVVLVEGRYLPFALQSNRSESVFLASCTPVVLPETRESVVQGATNIFTSIHSMDMKYLHIDKTAESHMEYSRSELVGVSWYNLLHWDSIRTAYCKHQTVIQSDQERSSTALLRIQSRSGRWFWVHCVLQVKDTSEECQHPIIVCTNQVLSEREAEIMRASSWLYQYSSQSKFTYGVCPQLQAAAAGGTTTTTATTTNTTASAVAPIPAPAQPSLGYGPEVVDYNGRPAGTAATLVAIPYGIPPTELDIAAYQTSSSSSHVAVVDENAQLGHWPKERTMLVKQEPTEVYGDSGIRQQRSSSRTRHHAGQEVATAADNAAEPVDMSINNTAPEQQHDDDMHTVPHCHNQGPAEFCPCNKPHVTMGQHNNKSPSRPMSSSSLTYLRAGNKTISHYLASNQSPQQSPTQPQPLQQLSPSMAPSPDHNGTPKYNIVDLDKLGHPGDQHHIDIYGPTYAQKRQLLLLHQTKVQPPPPPPPPPPPGLEPHPCVTDPSHHHHHHHHLALHHTYGYDLGQDQWTSPSASASPTTTVVLPQQQHQQQQQLWPDCGLQRVPDVVHQELSPYITTPTTPIDTPDDSSTDHHTPETPVSVFNFDWPVEQHVPNLRVLSFRTPGYVDTRRPSFQEVQPITLQLPRKKNLHTESTGNRDYAK